MDNDVLMLVSLLALIGYVVYLLKLNWKWRGKMVDYLALALMGVLILAFLTGLFNIWKGE